MNFFSYITSRRVWGGITVALAQILPVLTAGAFGPKAAAWGTAIGVVLFAVGAKGADAANGAPASDGVATETLNTLAAAVKAAHETALQAQSVSVLAAQAVGVPIAIAAVPK